MTCSQWIDYQKNYHLYSHPLVYKVTSKTTDYPGLFSQLALAVSRFYKGSFTFL